MQSYREACRPPIMAERPPFTPNENASLAIGTETESRDWKPFLDGHAACIAAETLMLPKCCLALVVACSRSWNIVFGPGRKPTRICQALLQPRSSTAQRV